MVWRKMFPLLVAGFSLLLCVLFAPAASAERPEDTVGKGAIPACSTELEREGGSHAAEPVPIDASTVFVGLKYDRDAAYEASFLNLEGGFRIGCFDEDRQFQPFAEAGAYSLTVRAERKWYVLFDERFDSEEEAEDYVVRFHAFLFQHEGSIRAICGPYRNVEEAEYMVRWFGVPGKAWRENCLVVYNGGWQLCYLTADRDEVSIQAISEGKAVTVFDEKKYFGAFTLRRWEDRMTVINAVDMEDYVKGVIPYEMDPSWPSEALKAQAVCARTYAAYHLHEYEEDYGFDVTDDTESQVYMGLGRANEISDAAVDATAGLYVRYRGELCDVYYFSLDGGATEDGVHIFGEDRPYLAGKIDPFEPDRPSSVSPWESLRSREYVTSRLNSRGYTIGTVVKIEPMYSELENVIGLTYIDEEGNRLTLYNRDSYLPLSLNSARFSVSETEDGFVFRGTGWGHNCGMSQWGAYAMASDYGYSADDIIRFYFTGAYIG